ncbi:MAG: GNAT family N-acetyltransferase [Gammaproteobacteria bacterium]
MTASTVRRAVSADLDAINRVIERAVMGWHLAERVKRLSLPLYRYDQHDFDALELHVALAEDGRIMGVAAWEQAASVDLSADRTGLLLHGLYVDPDVQRQGIGSQLLAAAEEATRRQGLDGILIKAQRDAEPFFLAAGWQPVPVDETGRHYPYRLWKTL